MQDVSQVPLVHDQIMVIVILFNWQSICYSSWSRASQGIEKNELEHQFAVCFSSFTRDTKQAWMAVSEKKSHVFRWETRYPCIISLEICLWKKTWIVCALSQ